jgi:hypothetical protein
MRITDSWDEVVSAVFEDVRGKDLGAASARHYGISARHYGVSARHYGASGRQDDTAK